MQERGYEMFFHSWGKPLRSSIWQESLCMEAQTDITWSCQSEAWTLEDLSVCYARALGPDKEICWQGTELAQEKEVCCVIKVRIWRSEEWFDIRHKDTGFENLFCLFSVFLWLVHPHYPFLPLGTIMYILWHCILQVWDVLFDSDFTGRSQLRDCLESPKRP